MKYVFKTPDLGEGTTQAEIVEWRVKVGDFVREDQPIADLMTDKATVEISSPVHGTIVALRGAPGETMAVGSELVVFDIAGEGAGRGSAPSAECRRAAPRALSATAVAEPKDAAVDRSAASATPTRTSSAASLCDAHAGREAGRFACRAPHARPSLASRSAIRARLRPGRAHPAGRSRRLRRCRAARAAVPRATAAPRDDSVEEIKIIGLRRKIAERMQDAKRRIPHIAYIEELDVTALEDLREHLNAQHGAARGKLSLLPFLMRAMVKALGEIPAGQRAFRRRGGHRAALSAPSISALRRKRPPALSCRSCAMRRRSTSGKARARSRGSPTRRGTARPRARN